MKKINTKERGKERENLIEKMLTIIQQNPGIRPSELNRQLGRVHTAHYRQILIGRGLVRRERTGAAVRYYAIVSGDHNHRLIRSQRLKLRVS